VGQKLCGSRFISV